MKEDDPEGCRYSGGWYEDEDVLWIAMEPQKVKNYENPKFFKFLKNSNKFKFQKIHKFSNTPKIDKY